MSNKPALKIAGLICFALCLFVLLPYAISQIVKTPKSGKPVNSSLALTTDSELKTDSEEETVPDPTKTEEEADQIQDPPPVSRTDIPPERADRISTPPGNTSSYGSNGTPEGYSRDPRDRGRDPRDGRGGYGPTPSGPRPGSSEVAPQPTTENRPPERGENRDIQPTGPGTPPVAPPTTTVSTETTQPAGPVSPPVAPSTTTVSTETTQPAGPGTPPVAPSTTTASTETTQPAGPGTPPVAPSTTTVSTETTQPAGPGTPSVTPPKTETVPPTRTVTVPPSTTNNTATAATSERRLKFNFKNVLWRDAIRWVADESKLSLTMQTPPQGTFSYVDNRSFTPAEAIDVLNKFLLLREYSLIRVEEMLILLEPGQGVPPEFIQPITPDKLDEKGEFELACVLFTLKRTTTEIIQGEVESMIRPPGTLVARPTSQQLLITERGGQLRAIRSIIERLDDPAGTGSLTMVELDNVSADEGVGLMREFLNIEEKDKSLRIAIDASGQKVFLGGRQDLIEQAKEFLKQIDEVYESPDEVDVSLAVYTVDTADPAVVLAVCQTRLAGRPKVRLSLDQKTSSIILQGQKEDHDTVKSIIDEMQVNASRIEVISLKKVSPSAAAEAIKKFFEVTTTSTTTASTPVANDPRRSNNDPRARQPQPTQPTQSTQTPITPPAPVVQADAMNRQIIVKATSSQIAQIKTLLVSMGETSFGEGGRLAGYNQRIIPIPNAAMDYVLGQAGKATPLIMPNEVRVTDISGRVVPIIREQPIPEKRIIPFGTPDNRSNNNEPQPHEEDQIPASTFTGSSVQPLDRSVPVRPRNESPFIPASGESEDVDSEIDRLIDETFETKPGKLVESSRNEVEFRYVRYSRVIEDDDEEEEPVLVPLNFDAPQDTPEIARERRGGPDTFSENRSPRNEPFSAPPTPPAPRRPVSEPGSPVSISVGTDGVIIDSKDLEALDQLEDLLLTLSDPTVLDKKTLVIYYLKNNAAESVSSILQSLMNSSASSLSSMAENEDLYDNSPMRAILDYISEGGNVQATGSMNVTTEPRLNALFIQANPIDHRTIERLLPLLDQLDSPEDVMHKAKPQLIKLHNIQASYAMEKVQSTFAENIGTGQGNMQGGRNQQQQMPGMQGGIDPRMMMQMLQNQGGRGMTGRGGTTLREEIQKMTLDVEPYSNSLIVSAPEALFQKVNDFVTQLDEVNETIDEVYEIVSIKNISADMVQSAVTSFSDKVTVTRGGSTTGSGQSNFNRGGTNPFGGGGTNQFRSGGMGGMQMPNMGGGSMNRMPNMGGGGGMNMMNRGGTTNRTTQRR